MSSGQSKRNRDQTSPTGSTPYNEYKKSAVETERVDCPAARKALFQQWTKGEEKLLVSFVALHCLDLDSAWPKYKDSHPLWEEASKFLSVQSDGIFHRSGRVWLELRCFTIKYGVLLLAVSCRTRIFKYLSKRFPSVSEAELHYGIDLEGSDEDDSSKLALASPIQGRTGPKCAVKRSRTSRRSIGVQTDVECQELPAASTPQTVTAATQTDSLQTRIHALAFLESQPLSSQVCSRALLA